MSGTHQVPESWLLSEAGLCPIPTKAAPNIPLQVCLETELESVLQ